MDTNKYGSDVIEIDLMEVAMLLLHRIWLIVLCALATGAVGFVLSKFVVTEQFESVTKIYVLNRQNDNTLTYSDVQLGTQLTRDFPELIKSRYVAEQVIAAWDLPYNYETLTSKIDVVTQSDTRIISIIVTDEDPQMAQHLANEIRKVASERIKSVMDIQAVNVVDEANFPEHPASPSVGKWTIIAALIGAFLCMAIILLRFMLDDTIKTADDIERYLGLSTLGMIPEREDPEKTHKSSGHTSHSREQSGSGRMRESRDNYAEEPPRRSVSDRADMDDRDDFEMSKRLRAAEMDAEEPDLEEINLEDIPSDNVGMNGMEEMDEDTDYMLGAERRAADVKSGRISAVSGGNKKYKGSNNSSSNRRASNVQRIRTQGGQINAVD